MKKKTKQILIGLRQYYSSVGRQSFLDKKMLVGYIALFSWDTE